MSVTFVLTGEPDLAALRDLDPDRDWRHFVTGERAWILQTYLRLRAAGFAVSLSDEVPDDGVVVFGSKQRHRIRTIAGRQKRSILVGVRADMGEALIADLEVVQNRRQADERRRFFMPHWPQPGLIGRDERRGTRIENVVFKGFALNLRSEFAAAPWRDWLEARGMHWVSDAVPYRRDVISTDGLAWNDFRDADLVLAVRPPKWRHYPGKPATKLYNAWQAGVPALLGPELAFRDLRMSDLDYVEVSDAAGAQDSIVRLQANPDLYRRMVANGLRRSQTFSVAAIQDRWAHLLFDYLPRLHNAPHVRRWRGRPLRTKEAVRFAARLVKMQNLF